MLFIEELWELQFFDYFRSKTQVFPELFLQSISDSMVTANCKSADLETCRNDAAAFTLKFVAIASILIAGIVGVAIPLVGKHRRFLRTDGSLFVAAKAFAAGVILATGFVHMLSGGSKALNDSCLPEYPWSKFPFAGFFAMGRVGSVDAVSESGIVPVVDNKERNGKVFGEEEGGGMHIVGMHAHAAHHRHSHPHGQDACEGLVIVKDQAHGHGHGHGQGHGHGHSHGFGDGDEENGVRHVVVSQVLELGIVSHSIIIGISLGVSNSPCTIRPLIAALSFHQFFEGFALGGCISQAQFKTSSAALMACFFAITTPLGIGIGTGIASVYNPYGAGALIVEGVLDSMSAGILVYMALVDLIAADFLSKRMSCNFRLQVVSYFMLFVGAGLMSLLAIWA
ncbi:hypothetical protein Patl1_13028 [Pistacia atlantica]|uniref:Uncharacterized protein n=1 Tax=Pistacia atlantica TaxID=434234 RepID=A0ACC1AWC4_9ROSI|nr:hypothetical protein Patl1_13028 [Pistacia atlantica]